MLPGLIEVSRDGVLYQLNTMGMLWPALGAGLGVAAAAAALGARFGARETRPGVLAVMFGYAAFGAQAVVAAVGWMPVERSFGQSAHVGSLFSTALWADLGMIALGTGAAAFGLAFWLLHRPEEDPHRVPVAGAFGAALALCLGLSVPGHLWGAAAAAVGTPPVMQVGEVRTFHVGQTVERPIRLGHLSTQGLFFRRTVWVDLRAEEWEAWRAPPVRLSADSPGQYNAEAVAARGPFTMRQPVPFTVGEDRGDPSFQPALGDRWRYAQLSGVAGNIEGVYAGDAPPPEDAARLTLEVTDEQVVEGLRVLTLTRTWSPAEGVIDEETGEPPEDEVTSFALYNLDGHTWLRAPNVDTRDALVPDAWRAQLPDPPAPPEGLWYCEAAFVAASGCLCFEPGGPQQGVAYCVEDTTPAAPGIIRGVLAVLTVGITEITGAMDGVGETRYESGLVLLDAPSDP